MTLPDWQPNVSSKDILANLIKVRKELSKNSIPVAIGMSPSFYDLTKDKLEERHLKSTTELLFTPKIVVITLLPIPFKEYYEWEDLMRDQLKYADSSENFDLI